MLAACGVSVAVLDRQPAVVHLAAQMTGEHWYTLEANGNHSGYFRTRSRFNADGSWSYNSHTHILMQAGAPLNIEKMLTFSAAPPHELVSAAHLVRQGGATRESVHITRNSDGQLSAELADGSIRAVDWRYDLASYLGVELNLSGSAPTERIRSRVLDLSQLNTYLRTYEVAQRHPTVLTHAAPLGATRIELDENHVPRRIHASEVFRFQRASFAEAMAPADPAFKASYKIPLAEPLNNVPTIRTLEIHIDGADLTLRRRPADQAAPAAALALPRNDPRLSAFAQDAVANTERPLDALVAAVHYQLNYREGSPATNVLEAFERGYGECTDFADLFTTLALSLGWQARTVYGLAYDATDPPGLAMHAWNEVKVDGQWHSVDPTWNQNPIDATHMRLDDQTLARLKYLQGSRGLSATVRQLRYD